MKLSIVIGTFNRFKLLQACLDALRGKIHCEHEIIVIDAGSTDGTLEYLASLEDVSVVPQGQLLGQAKSLNQVVQSLKSDYLCWLSDDNVVQAGALDLAVEILGDNPDIGLVGLKVKDVTGPRVNRPYLGAIWASGVLNCNQGVLPTKLMQALGGFDELFRDYGIDADLTTRVLLSGYKVVLTKRIAVLHFRDHQTDNWIDHDGRNRRLGEARSLYNRKFSLLVQSAGTKMNLFGAQLALTQTKGEEFIMRLVDSRFFPARWVAALIRDMGNARKARFISDFDLLENLFKPFYLVQHIPEHIRSKVEYSGELMLELKD